MKRLLIFIVFLFPNLTSIANETPTEMRLVGQAKLSVLFWDVYQSSLYTPSGRFDGITAPLKLKLVYLRNIESKALVSATREQWQKLGLYQNAHEQWLDQLQTMWPSVRPGDSIVLDWTATGHSHFYYNDKLIGSIASPEFGKLFAAIWLSEKTEYPQVRKQLIGASS